MPTHKWVVAKRIIVVTLLLGVVALVVGCYPSHPMSTFDAKGPVAQQQLDLFVLILWLAAVVFVAVVGALLYAVIRFRRRLGQDIPKQVHGNTRLEVAWTIAPALVLVVIAVPTITTIFDTANTPEQEEVLEVKVTGHQWWWEFEYPQLGLVTANELHIPPVPWVIDVTLESEDVIHSFWIPKLVGKTDVVPNHINTLWFSADVPALGEPVTYLGQCAEFCGISHALMRFRVIVEPSKETFDDWVAGQKAAPGVPTGDAAAGADLFANGEFAGRQRCVFCHTIEGMLIKGKVGPDLTHVGSRTTIAAGILENTPENLAAWLRDPPAVKPGAKMPVLGLTEGQVSDMVSYLQSLN